MGGWEAGGRQGREGEIAATKVDPARACPWRGALAVTPSIAAQPTHACLPNRQLQAPPLSSAIPSARAP